MSVIILWIQGRKLSCQSDPTMQTGKASYVRIICPLTRRLGNKHAWVETIVAQGDRECGTPPGKSVS